MGYNHYWHREEEIETSLFERIVLDFEGLILPLEDAGVRLAGYAVIFGATVAFSEAETAFGIKENTRTADNRFRYFI